MKSVPYAIGVLAMAGGLIAATPGVDPAQEAPLQGPEADRTPEGTQTAAPEGGCQGGCAFVPRAVEDLGEDGILALLGTLADLPPGTSCLAFDTLLFHGDEVASRIARSGAAEAGEAWAEILRRETSRRTVRVSVRVEGEDGACLVSMDEPATLGIKYHVHPAGALPFPTHDINGTVERVGLDRCWARF